MISTAAAAARRGFATTSATRSNIGRLPVRLPANVQLLRAAPPPAAHSTKSSAKAALPHDDGGMSTRLGRTEVITVAGPLGTTRVHLLPFVSLTITRPPRLRAAAGAAEAPLPDAEIRVSVKNADEPAQRAIWGTTRAILHRAITGVHAGYSLPIKFVGVGYRAAVLAADADLALPRRVSLRLGYCNPVEVPIPADIEVAVAQNGARMVVSGVDWQAVTQFAAQVRKWRPPEPYNGKGVFVGEETVRRKVGKKK